MRLYSYICNVWILKEDFMETKGKDNYVEVFGGSPWEAEVVKGLLESNNIQAFLKDETMGSVTSPYAGLGGEMKVLVNEADYGKAVQLVNEKDKSE